MVIHGETTSALSLEILEICTFVMIWWWPKQATEFGPCGLSEPAIWQEAFVLCFEAS